MTENPRGTAPNFQEYPVSSLVTTPIEGLDFVSIDFETANAKRASVCQIGIVKVRDGIPGKIHTHYVMPPPGFDNFAERNIQIHGITRATLAGDPHKLSWAAALERLIKFTGDLPLIGHNVSVERSIIVQATEAIGGVVPEFEYLCTMGLAKTHYPEAESYKLDRLTEAFGLPAFQHHDAGHDAAAAAHLVLHVARDKALSELPALWPPVKKRTYSRPYNPAWRKAS